MASGKDGSDRDDLHIVVSAALSRAVARREIPDDIVAGVVKRISGIHRQNPISWIDVCVYGICIDYFVEPPRLSKVITELLKVGPVRKFELFPWGIITTDLLQVRVEHRFDELAPFIDTKALASH